jgi:hypothetical protein
VDLAEGDVPLQAAAAVGVPGSSIRDPIARPFSRITAVAARLFALGLAATVYTYFSTGGSWRFADGMGYFSALGDAFLHGHLHLDAEPPAELVNDPDPFDPSHRDALRARGIAIMSDASLFDGHYYLYWGPVPGVIHALWRIATGSELADSLAQVLASVAILAAFTAILSRARTCYWPRAPAATVWGSAAAFGLGGISLFMAGRPSVYHEAILVGAAFLTAAWYALMCAYDGRRRRTRLLALAGLLMGCAVGARLTNLAYAASAGLAVAVVAWPGAKPKKRAAAWSDVAAYGAPLMLCGGLLGAYNAARFGSPFEFGWHYQLQGLPVPAGTGLGWQSLRDAQLYWLAVPVVGFEYPYFRIASNLLEPLGHYLWFPNQAQFAVHPVEPPFVSMFLLAPIGLLSLTAPVFYRVAKRPAQVLLLSAGLGLLPATALLGTIGGASARYAADLLPALTLVGTLALLHWSSGGGRRRRDLVVAAGACWALSIAVGVMLGLGAWLYSFPEAARQARSASYALTDPVAWRLAAARHDQGFVEHLENANDGMESAPDGRQFFWMGAGDTVIHVLATGGGSVRLTAKLLPGPSLPGSDVRHIEVEAGAGFDQRVVAQGETSLDLLIPVPPGGSDLRLRSLDTPSLPKLSNGDTRPLLVRVEDLHVVVP